MVLFQLVTSRGIIGGEVTHRRFLVSAAYTVMKRRNDLTDCAFYRGLAGVLVFLLPPRGLDILMLAPCRKRVWCLLSSIILLFAFFSSLFGVREWGSGGSRCLFVVFDSPVSRSHGWLIFIFFWVASSMYIPWIRGTVGVFLRRLLGSVGWVSVFILCSSYTAVLFGELAHGKWVHNVMAGTCPGRICLGGLGAVVLWE